MKPEHAGSRDHHLQPNQLCRQSGLFGSVFPIALFVTARFDGPTVETPALKRSLQASKVHLPQPLVNATFPRPHVKIAMPSSLAYSGTRSFNENARSLNLNPRLGSDDTPMDESRPKNEDVFLNIARADSGRRDSIGRSDFRRVSEDLSLWARSHSCPDIGRGSPQFPPLLATSSLTTRASHVWDIRPRVCAHQRPNKPPHPISDTATPTPCFLIMILLPPPTAPTRQHLPTRWMTPVAFAITAWDPARDPPLEFPEVVSAVQAQTPRRGHLL